MQLASSRPHARSRSTWRAVALSASVALVASLFVALPGTPASATTGGPVQLLDVDGIVAGEPSIAGTARVGSELSVEAGTWSAGVEFTYQWNADSALLSGQISSTLVLTPDLLGKQITATVTGSREGDVPVSVDTPATSPVDLGVLVAPTPTISGKVLVGSPLTAQPGSWPAGVAHTYAWFADGTLVAGATSSTYTPRPADAGTSITVQVRGTLAGYAPASAISLPTAPVEALHKTVITPPAAGTPRLAGASRYETAVKVSARYAANVPVVFVATGTNFPDALSAASAASLLGGPLLLTPRTALPAAVLKEVKRLNPAQIYVIGGTGAVSNSILNALSAVAPTKRLGEANRYATGLRIVNETFTSATTAFIATGRSFPDALAATGAAGANNAPVILVDGKSSKIPESVKQTLSRLDVTDIAVVGGPGAVSAAIEQQLWSLGYGVTRYGGSNRYSTAAIINDSFFGPGSSDTMFLATGTNFPDALAGAALAGRLGAPLYVTSAACVPDPVRNSIIWLAPSTKVVMGGTSVVSAAAASNTGCLAAAVPTISGSAKVTSTLTASPGAWTSGSTFRYQWYANGAAISGATGKTLALGTAQHGKRISVKVTGSKSGYTTASATSKVTAVVSYPDRTKPVGGSWNCPAWAPIKGNASSMIYHVKGGQFYDKTNPEECFRTEQAARNAGYRASKR